MPAAGVSAAAPGASGGLQALIPGMGAVCVPKSTVGGWG